MGIEAQSRESELNHIGAADDDRTRLAQPPHHAGVGFGRGGIGERFRPGSRNVAGDVEQILDRHRDAGERRGHDAVRAQCVARLRFGQRRLAMRAQEHARALARGNSDAHERILDQCTAGGFAGGEFAGERQYGFHFCLMRFCIGLRNTRAPDQIVGPRIKPRRLGVVRPAPAA